MFNAIYQFCGSIIRFFYDLTGDFTVGLFFFTLIMQIVLLPLGIKQQRNSVKQASLAPKIAALRKKYAGRDDQATRQKFQQEQMELYQRENFNPAGGCLPLLIQLPIIMLLYNVVRSPLSFILKYSKENIEAIRKIVEAAGNKVAEATLELDLASKMTSMGKDAFAELGLETFPDFKLFGMDLTQAPLVDGKLVDLKMLIIPIVTFIAMYGSSFIIRRFTYQSPEVKEQQKSMSMKIMNISMPLMSVYFAAIWPGTLGVYWILRNILQTLQQIILSKAIPVPKFTEEDFKAAERELAGKSKKKDKEKKEADPNRPKVRSLHYIDADDDETAVIPEAPKKKAEVKNVPDEDPKAEETSADVENASKDAHETASDSVVAPAPLKDDTGRRTK